MFGAGGGPPIGGGGAPGAAQAGLPFGGIPHELQDGVDLLLKEEPERGESEAVFTQLPSPHESKKLTLTTLLMEYPGMCALATLLVGLIALFTQLGPSFVSYAINHGLTPPHYDYGVVVVMAILYLVSICVSAGAQYGQARVTGRLASWVMNDLRIKVFRHLQRLSLDFFTEEKAGVVMSRMTSDIENLQQLLQDGLAQFAIQGLTMVVITVFLFATNATLAAITVFAVLPPLVIMSIWFKRASERGYDKVRDGIALVLADLSESLQGVRIVSAHNRQRYNVETHRDIVGSYRDANNYTGRINGIYGPGSQVISVFGQLLILGIGGAMYLHHPQEINLGPADRLLPLREPVLLADPAPGAAVQHLPAGPGVGDQAARPARERALGPGGTRRRGAPADPRRDPLRPRVVRLRPRRARAARRRPDH